jgi:3,4-dihydroxy 2-butanone 4-phosphate synthase/GTP cyclohydrolase II
MRCDCGEQLEKSMEMIEHEGKGAIIYINQEGRGIGLTNKLKAYKLQEQGLDTVDANVQLGFKPDERDYGVGAQMLREIGSEEVTCRLVSGAIGKDEGLLSKYIVALRSADDI